MNKMVDSCIWVHRADLLRNGRISQTEYVLFKLHQMQKLDENLLIRLTDRFKVCNRSAISRWGHFKLLFLEFLRACLRACSLRGRKRNARARFSQKMTFACPLPLSALSHTHNFLVPRCASS